MRIALGEKTELHQIEQTRDLGDDRGLVRPCALGTDPQSKGHVLKDRHMPEKGVMLEHKTHIARANIGIGRILAMKQDATSIRGLKPRDDAQERCLTAARGTEQRHQLSRWNVEMQVVASCGGAKTLRQMTDFNAHGMSRPCQEESRGLVSALASRA